MKLSLRPYQERGRDEIRICYRQLKRAVLYVLPTGGGKTVLYAAIAEGSAARGKRILILEHRKELIRQASLALGHIGVPHQVIAPKAKVAGIRRAHLDKIGWPMIDPNAHVAVASVQTLTARMDWLAEFDPDLIVIDEAHHALAETWANIIAACPKALLLGVTATPEPTHGMGLGSVFEAMVMGPTPRELIAEGYLLPPRVVAPPLRFDPATVKVRRDGEPDPDSMADALNRREITGDAIEHYTRLAPGRPAIVFAANLKHAEDVAKEFRAAGYRFEVIHGGMLDTERDRLIYGLVDGTVQGLVTKDLISEGTDLPVAEVAIMLRMTESLVWFLQASGRVLRPVFADGYDLTQLEGRMAAIAASGKRYGLIIDHVGNCGRLIDGEFVPKHGLPHADRDWALEGRKRRKRGAPAEEVVEMRQCPECYAAHDPAPACPACGFTYKVRTMAPPKRVEGELLDVPDDLAAAAAGREAAKRAQAAARSAEALIATGMNAKRAEHVLAARAEKARLQQQVKDLIHRWYDTVGRPRPAGPAIAQAFGFASTEVMRMKPKALREAVERVTEAILALQLGAPANDNGFAIRKSG